MKFRHLKTFREWACSTVFGLVTILAALFFLQQECRAQEQFIFQPDASASPLSYVHWFSGPQTVTLQGVADVNIPQGCRLTDAYGAQMILDNLNYSVPDDLVGILVPTSGKWMAILEYSPRGYVKDPDVTRINTKSVLEQTLNQMGGKNEQSSVTSLTWQSSPAYDAGRHSLGWTFLVTTPSNRKVLSQTVALLGRHGVLQITIFRPLSLTGVPSPKQLADNITFKNGERYIDYQSGDKIAELELAELISGVKHSRAAGFFRGGSGTVTAWIYFILAACLVTGCVVVIRRRNKTKPRPQAVLRKHKKQHRPKSPVPVPAPAVKNKAQVNNAPSSPSPAAVKNGTSNTPAWPKPVFKHRHRRRKRIFDYPKFYTKVMRELSPQLYTPGNMTNGKSHSHAHTNGHSIENSNSHSNGHSNGHAPSNGANSNQTTTTKSELENLVAAQKSLIQDQRSLLEQQARLLEEKRQIIEAQTAFVKIQSGLAADRQSASVQTIPN